MDELLKSIRNAEMQLSSYKIALSRCQPGGAMTPESLEQSIAEQEANLASLKAELDGLITTQGNTVVGS